VVPSIGEDDEVIAMLIDNNIDILTEAVRSRDSASTHCAGSSLKIASPDQRAV